MALDIEIGNGNLVDFDMWQVSHSKDGLQKLGNIIDKTWKEGWARRLCHNCCSETEFEAATKLFEKLEDVDM